MTSEKSETLPKWFTYFSDTKQSYINPVKITSAYASKYKAFWNALKEDTPSVDTRIVFIADEEQTAFISAEGNFNALFFDVGQSLILKSMVSLLHNTSSFDAVDFQEALFKVSQAAMSLRVGALDERYMDLLGDVTTPHYDNTLRVNPNILRDAEGAIKMATSYGREKLWDFVDLSIMAHELHHILRHYDSSPSKYYHFIQTHYDSIIAHARDCEGLFPIDNRLRHERNQKFAYLTNNRDHLLEEMACDLFAVEKTFTSLLEVHSEALNEKDVFLHVCQFAAMNTLLFSLNMLHTNVINRAYFHYEYPYPHSHYVGEDENFNVRRLMMQQFTTDFLMAFLTDISSDKRVLSKQHAYLVKLQNAVYSEATHYMMIPVIQRTFKAFRLIDTTYPLNSRNGMDKFPSSTERRRLAGFSIYLDPMAVSSMLEKESFP